MLVRARCVAGLAARAWQHGRVVPVPTSARTTTVPTLPAAVLLREVGPRDGLQAERPVSVAVRADLVGRLVDAGFANIELCSFVSPTAVPAMAGGAEVVALVGPLPGVVRTALVPNVRGARAAVEVGIDAVTVTISASAEYNLRNVRRTIAESLTEIVGIVELAADATPAPTVDVVVSCAFGSPYEGDIAPAAVRAMCARLRDLGAVAVTLADTTGMATPRRIDDVLDLVGVDVGLHLHDTRGAGLANLYAGLLAGVRRFDTSVGGLGGSPFAAGASGNVASEDVVALLDDLGVATGVDLERLIGAAHWLEGVVGHRLASRVAYAGPRLKGTAAGAVDLVPSAE